MFGCNIQRLETYSTQNSLKFSMFSIWLLRSIWKSESLSFFNLYTTTLYSHFRIRTGKPDLSVEKLHSLMKLAAYSVLKTQVYHNMTTQLNWKHRKFKLAPTSTSSSTHVILRFDYSTSFSGSVIHSVNSGWRLSEEKANNSYWLFTNTTLRLVVWQALRAIEGELEPESWQRSTAVGSTPEEPTKPPPLLRRCTTRCASSFKQAPPRPHN